MRQARDFLRALKQCDSGNAMILMAMGMPMLIGGTGFAVDTAQYYLWKRELQFATDQAALAGAWARTETATQGTYASRAKQEFDANIAVLTGATTNPVVKLADYATGTNNSVAVSATASRSLPFTSYILKKTVTVSANAQATFEAATNYTTCLLALDKSAAPGFTLGGSASGTVTCGAGTLSTAPQAMKKNGNPSASLSYLVAGGGIDGGFSANGTLSPNVSNLEDPYEGLTPPKDATARTYTCPSTTTSTSSSSTKTATITTTTTTTYTYWQGKNQKQATQQVTYNGTGAQTGGSGQSVANNQSVGSGITEGTVVTAITVDDWTGNNWPVSGSKNEEIYEYKRVAEEKKYTNVTTASGGTGTTSSASSTYTVYPGTYSDISIGCDTYFSPGVYTLTGTLDFGTNHNVTGSDVMFVLTGSGSEKTKINSGSVVNLSGITKSTLTGTYSLSAKDAEKLQNMLIFDTKSTADLQMNGHANVGLNGILYMPKRNGKFNGNSTVSGSCMILALATLHFTGNNDLGSFCLSTGATGIDIGGSTVQVRLVA